MSYARKNSARSVSLIKVNKQGLVVCVRKLQTVNVFVSKINSIFRFVIQVNNKVGKEIDKYTTFTSIACTRCLFKLLILLINVIHCVHKHAAINIIFTVEIAMYDLHKHFMITFNAIIKILTHCIHKLIRTNKI